MTFRVRGGLAATLADGFEESLSNVTVRLYSPAEEPLAVSSSTAARPKETFAILSPDEVAAKQERLLGQDETDEDGQFDVQIEEDAPYQEDEHGRPAVFQIDVRVESVPGSTAEPERPVQFHLTTHQPRWREGESGLVADWETTVPKRNWCAVLEEAGIWSVCGRVTICDTTDPVAQLTVTAKDADIVQHDRLGSAVTNANGQFCIYYTRSDFEATPPPWGPIELTPGPDLYFRIEQAGQTRLEEDPSRGRQGARENAGHCETVDLCVEPREPSGGEADGGQTPVPTYWQRVGSTFDAPFIFPGSSDFDAEGYAGQNKYAITGAPTMEGSAPLFHSENPDQFVQYRFLVSENATSNPGRTPSGFKPVGAGNATYRNAFVEGVTVGEVLAYDAGNQVIRPVAVDVDESHVVGQGWVSVRDAVNDALGRELNTDLQTLRSNNRYFGWNDEDALLGIDTRQFTGESDVENASASSQVPDAGEPVPSDRRIGVEKIAVKFEARVVDANGSVLPSPGNGGSILSGATLNAMVVNNNAAFAAFENVDLAALQDKCQKLTGDVELAFTVHHPHLAGVRLTVERNDGPTEHLDDPDSEVSFDPSFSFTSGSNGSIRDIRHFTDSGLAILQQSDPNRPDEDPILAEQCGYVARLRVRPRLHNGNSPRSWRTRGKSIFYWEGSSP